ncbi:MULTISPECIES: acyl-CoA carboxylase subunit epsilon [Streptomyces]|uniref:Acyl-CoA carboxylase subunit epsilon n=1 Tax=Streptomyces eurythermus TaxID=42237 RepID=A0ABW6Z539_9ACTN|nr:acyl-CoA carboxylase subunit epsilon [Streptomyces sp. DSM 40868]WDM16572.1 acyl-CoA carboxylase subunit epsilon [Streptomyces lavenduligriseus]
MSAGPPWIRITRGAPGPVEVAALTAVLLTLSGTGDGGAGTVPAPAAPWPRTRTRGRSAGSWAAGDFPAWRTDG